MSIDLKQPGQKIDCQAQAFLLRRMPIVASVQDCLIKNLQNSLGQLLKESCILSGKRINMGYASHCLKRLSSQDFVYAINVNPIKGKIWVFLEKNTVYHILDRAFGGTGSAVGQLNTSLFSVEARIFKNLLSSCVANLRCSFKDKPCLRFDVEENQEQAVTIKHFSEKTLMVVCPFTVSIKQHCVGALTLLWPYECWIEAQDLNMDDREPPVKKETAQHFKMALCKALSCVNIELKSRIIHQAISLSQIRRWKIGDLISLDFDQPVCLMVESIPIFSVKLGNANNKYALKIVDKV